MMMRKYWGCLRDVHNVLRENIEEMEEEAKQAEKENEGKSTLICEICRAVPVRSSGSFLVASSGGPNQHWPGYKCQNDARFSAFFMSGRRKTEPYNKPNNTEIRITTEKTKKAEDQESLWEPWITMLRNRPCASLQKGNAQDPIFYRHNERSLILTCELDVLII
ncbi:hypothetical protein Q1695_012403 [Nippostrongylus brasiliensis]|nr:hypothetical protein Q1695_012403 [Nippostrongylus brasiliensis]